MHQAQDRFLRLLDENASILELLSVIRKMYDALKSTGVIYTSFKYGDFEGERNGRYFTDFMENTFRV